MSEWGWIKGCEGDGLLRLDCINCIFGQSPTECRRYISSPKVRMEYQPIREEFEHCRILSYLGMKKFDPVRYIDLWYGDTKGIYYCIGEGE